MNVANCELISHPNHSPNRDILKTFIQVDLEDSSLSDAPLFAGRQLAHNLAQCCLDLSRAIDKLDTINSHEALIPLRSSFSAPQIQHTLRCSPFVNHTAPTSFDELNRAGITRIVNISLSHAQWLQASLPVRYGGLGVRRAVSLAIPAYMASAASTRRLQDLILTDSCANDDDIETSWTTAAGLYLLLRFQAL